MPRFKKHASFKSSSLVNLFQIYINKNILCQYNFVEQREDYTFVSLFIKNHFNTKIMSCFTIKLNGAAPADNILRGLHFS